MTSQWLVIGISGVTCGGKSTLAASLYDFFTKFRNNKILRTNLYVGETHVVSQDDYFLPKDDPRHKRIECLNHINWEVLSAIDMDKMIADVQDILKDDFILYDKTNETTTFQDPEQQQHQVNILIVEGFLIFNHKQLRDLCQVKFHIHLPYEKCYERRKARVYDPADVVGYFEMCVWPLYERHFREYNEVENVIFLNGDITKERIFKFALNCINNYF